MPVLLEGVVRFPSSYEPWYVYEATLIGSPTAFEFGDLLFPDASGDFDRIETDNAVVVTGYVYALEKFVTGMTKLQVAVPGSAFPFIAEGVILPTSLVMIGFAATVQSAAVANAAALAAGKVIGRMRNHHEDHENLRVSAANDVIIVLSGCV